MLTHLPVARPYADVDGLDTEQAGAASLAALAHSERVLSDFFEQAVMPLHWVGGDGTILRANRAELDLLGYAHEEYVGHHIADFHVDGPVIEDILGRLGANEVLHNYEARLRHKDGSIRDVLINSSVLWQDSEFVHTRCFTQDVTERKAAEAHLAVRTRQLSAMANLGQRALAGGDLVALMDEAASVLSTTLGVELVTVLELEPDGEALSLRAGVGWRDGVVGHATVGAGTDSQAGFTLLTDRPVVVEDLRTETRFTGPPLLREHGVVSGLSTVIQGRDGPYGVLGVHTTARRVFTDDDVAFVQTVASVLGAEITRRQTEERLREDRLRALVEHAQDIVCIVEADGTIRYVSPAAEALIDTDPADLIGDRRAYILHPEDRERSWLNFVAAVSQPGSRPPIEVRCRHRDESWRWIEMWLTNRLDDPSVRGIVVNGRDVTERKSAESTLRMSEERLRLALGAARMATWAWDIETGEVVWSDGADEVLGLPHDSVSTNDSYLALVQSADELDRMRLALRRAIAGNVDYASTYRLVTADGSMRWLESSGQVVEWGPDGRAVRMVGVVTDVTARKQAAVLQTLRNEVGLAVASAGSLGDLLQRCAEAIVEHLEAAFARIWLLDESGQTLELQASAGCYTHLDGGHARIPVGQFKIGRIASERRPHVTNDVPHDPRVSDPEWATREGMVAFAGHPIFAGDRLLGVVAMFARQPLSTQTVETIGAVVDTLGQAIGRKQAEDQRRLALAAWSRSFDALPDHLCILDRAGTIIQANRSMREQFEPVHGDLLGLDYRQCYCGTATPDPQPPCAAVLSGGPAVGTEMTLPTLPGWYFVASYPIDIDGERQGAISVVRDITDRRAAEEALAHQALHDPLTDLPNRRLFGDRLVLALESARQGGDGVAVLLLDLDRFKVVNDSMGHAAGDELLIAAGRRLNGALRRRDTLARFGGDEFVVLLDDVESPSEATATAARLIAAMRPRFRSSGQEVFVGASVGVACFDRVGVGHVDLVRQADAALHRAKSAGRGAVALYDAEMGREAVERQTLETDLRRALERAGLVVHYQPEVDLATGRITGAEALVRWQHPRLGLVPPGDFLPLAEETGLIEKIDALVLGEACRQAAQWRARRPTRHGFRMGVNLSARRLADPDLVGHVAAILAETGLAASSLELEITESVLVEHSRVMLDKLEALRAMGVRLAIDDFGSGYSSLGYLSRLPVDTLKLDRSFVQELGNNPRMAAVIGAVRVLAGGLGLHVLAEGIETVEQLQLLRDLGVETGQGYYFAKPAPPADFEVILD